MKLQKEEKVAVVYFGEGATSEGDFHVGLNFASVRKAPAIFFAAIMVMLFQRLLRVSLQAMAWLLRWRDAISQLTVWMGMIFLQSLKR